MIGPRIFKEKQRLQGAKTNRVPKLFFQIYQSKVIHIFLLRTMNNFWFVMKNNYKMLLLVGMTPLNYTSSEVATFGAFHCYQFTFILKIYIKI